MTAVSRQCVDCGRLTRPSNCSAHEYPGTIRYARRGLCDSCEQRHRRHGTISDFDTHTRRWALVADDYAMLRGEGYPLEVIASRLGMTFKALDRALYRHRDDPRARRPGQPLDRARQDGAA